MKPALDYSLNAEVGLVLRKEYTNCDTRMRNSAVTSETKTEAMYRRIKPLIFLVGLFVAMFLVIMPASGQSQLTAASKVAINGIGPIRVGMTVQQAEASVRTRLLSEGSKLENCWYVKPQGGPRDISFMVIEGQIAAVTDY
jgi:hypothetical protein